MNNFEFEMDKNLKNEKVTLTISRYDYEIIKRSLDESYYSELQKTPWEQSNKGEYHPDYWYRGNHITRRIKSVLQFIKKQVENK